MDSTDDTFAALLDRRLKRQNTRLWNHLLAWSDILDALGWCVALKTTDGTPHLTPNALQEITARALPPATWDDVLAYLGSIPDSSRRLDEKSIHLWIPHRSQTPVNITLPGLTPRETEVLGWLREGKTGPEIAMILGCAHRTVESHVARLYRKLGFSNRTQVLLN